MTQSSETFIDEVRAEAANDPQYQQGLTAVAEHEAHHHRIHSILSTLPAEQGEET